MGIPDDVHYDKMVVYLTEMIKIRQRSITSLQMQVDAQGKALQVYRDELTVSNSHLRKRKKSEISSAEDHAHKISSVKSVVTRNK